jgi:hypothetical protein
MSAIVTAVLAMVEQFLPMLGTSAATAALIDSIINALTSMLPFIIQEVQALAVPVKNIIAALSASPATTAAQLATLQSLDAQVDAAFDAAAADTDAGD